MLFGLLSLLMGHWIVFVARICVKSSVLSSRFYPCALEIDLKRVRHISIASENLNSSVPREHNNDGIREYCPEVLLMLCLMKLIIKVLFDNYSVFDYYVINTTCLLPPNSFVRLLSTF